ncbi:hypothetical protein D3C71_1287310 [compost metagenome]
MHGSIAVCARNPVWLPRYSSYKPGARYEVPNVPRTRNAELICQLRPNFHTLSDPSTESYWNIRPEALAVSDSMPVMPLSSGTSSSTKASLTLSLPLVTSALEEAQMNPSREAWLG